MYKNNFNIIQTTFTFLNHVSDNNNNSTKNNRIQYQSF